jgi:hypothetical protein
MLKHSVSEQRMREGKKQALSQKRHVQKSKMYISYTEDPSDIRVPEEHDANQSDMGIEPQQYNPNERMQSTKQNTPEDLIFQEPAPPHKP